MERTWALGSLSSKFSGPRKKFNILIALFCVSLFKNVNISRFIIGKNIFTFLLKVQCVKFSWICDFFFYLRTFQNQLLFYLGKGVKMVLLLLQEYFFHKYPYQNFRKQRECLCPYAKQIPQWPTADLFDHRTETLTDTRASVTLVSTAGRSEWTRILCSVTANTSSVTAFSGPRFCSRVEKLPPLPKQNKTKKCGNDAQD